MSGIWSVNLEGGGGAGIVNSVTGTPNQIDAAPNTGDVVLSIPNDFIAPGSVTVTDNVDILNGALFLNTGTGYTGTTWTTTQDKIQTVNDTPTTLVSLILNSGIGGGERILLVKAYINGYSADFAEAISSEVFASAFYPTGGPATLTGLPVINIIKNNAALDVNAVVTATHLVIEVSGLLVTNVNWVATYSYMYLHNET